MFSNSGDADKINQYGKRWWKMTKSLKRSIGITLILTLISALCGGTITLSMAFFSGGGYITGTAFLFYILLFFVALIYGSSNVIFKLPCKKILRILFFALWLIFYSALSYCILFVWIFLGFKFSDICWNINYLMMNCHCHPVTILITSLFNERFLPFLSNFFCRCRVFWVFLTESEVIFTI